MSQPTAKGKVIGRFTIGFDDETKASIADLKAKLDAVPHCLGFGNVIPIGGLLAAMQDTAANDSDGVVHHGENVKPELKQLGQWVFEDEPSHLRWAAIEEDGSVYLFAKKPFIDLCRWAAGTDEVEVYIGDGYDASNWQNSAINRQPVNDVDYLSETVPTIQDMDASEIIDDECDWLSESTLQITEADMQLIFIKNLSDVLIQRMHSMNRFSEDDYAIGGDKLMAWDIVANPKGDFAVMTGHNQDKRYFGGLYFVPYARGNHAKTVAGERANEYLKTLGFCTITEAELPAFRAALEACYA